ncbi:hypothetical protein PYK22_03029 [Pyrinomonas methylaliphatogenes]|uniref:Uncharacterized protein n=1 Tax=Pyrinomonas methylaliphatogenes TaxID=454194 RepID=A0A0B6X0V6_9BACT|nr:hypothetical protein PYK22_03029 [Pyrinomonas methylaliphatogenes]
MRPFNGLGFKARRLSASLRLVVSVPQAGTTRTVLMDAI